MNRNQISPEQLQVSAHYLWNSKWLLLTAGEFETNNYNSMTVGWGSIGTMWNRPFVQTVVRPTRYTYEFMNRYESFTLCAFPSKYRSALQLLGTKSGRDGDKIAESGLTPIASEQIAAPCFAEAELIIECKKMYYQDFDSSLFLNPQIEKYYPKMDYHRAYFGEIVIINGIDKYQYSA